MASWPTFCHLMLTPFLAAMKDSSWDRSLRYAAIVLPEAPFSTDRNSRKSLTDASTRVDLLGCASYRSGGRLEICLGHCMGRLSALSSAERLYVDEFSEPLFVFEGRLLCFTLTSPPLKRPPCR